MSEASRVAESYADASGMFSAHAMFRREFALLPALVRNLSPGDQDRADVVADHIDLLIIVLHEHHHAEDETLWPRLRERGSADVAALVHLMELHHANLEKISREIQTALRAWRASAATQGGASLAEALDRMLPFLDKHLSLEEERVVPMIERHITAAELDDAIQKGRARLPQEILPLVLGMVMYEAGGPAPPAGLQAQAVRAFAVHSQRVHGTETPPRSRA